MGLADDISAGTSFVLTSNIGAGVPERTYSDRFLEFIKPKLRLMNDADFEPLPEGGGLTLEMTRQRPLGLATTALTQGVNPAAQQIYDQMIAVTIKEYGAWVPLSSLVMQAHLKGKVSKTALGAVERLASQAGRSLEMHLKWELNSCGIHPLRADLDTTKVYAGALTTVTSKTSMASTGLAANTNYGDADYDCMMSLMTMTSGPAKGETRPISGYATSGGVITLTIGFDMLPEVGDTFEVTTPDALTSGDHLSYTNMWRARANLVKEECEPFIGTDYKAMLSVDQVSNLKDDTTWMAVQEYKERTSGIEDGFVKRFCGCRVTELSEPFGFPITTIGTNSTSYGPGSLTRGANYSASGAIQTALIYGKHAFAGCAFKRKGQAYLDPPIKVKTPNPYDKYDPLDRFSTAGWVVEAAFKSKWSLWCQGIWTYDAS